MKDRRVGPTDFTAKRRSGGKIGRIGDARKIYGTGRVYGNSEGGIIARPAEIGEVNDVSGGIEFRHKSIAACVGISAAVAATGRNRQIRRERLPRNVNILTPVQRDIPSEIRTASTFVDCPRENGIDDERKFFVVNPQAKTDFFSDYLISAFDELPSLGQHLVNDWRMLAHRSISGVDEQFAGFV